MLALRLSRGALALALVVLSCGAPPAVGTNAPEGSKTSAPVRAATNAPSAAPMASGAPAKVEAEAAIEKAPPFRSDETFRLWIRGGEIIDGSGKPRRRADVLVRGDRVAFVGEVDPSIRAEREIDAKGAVVTPGFFDAHAHGSAGGDVEYALAQGITTLVVGQDGTSPASDIGAWLSQIDAKKPRVNVATLVGHASVRGSARGGPEKRLENIRALVESAMRAGAFGLSMGLEYDPGRSAGMDELVAAAEPVGALGGVVMSHLRSEDDDKIEASLAELFEVCKRSKARAHVAHVKIVLGRGAERADRLLAELRKAREAGLPVTADLYPYAASYTSLSILFPDFARPPASYAEAKRKRKAELAAYLRARVEKRNGPAATLFGTGEYAGKTLADVASRRGIAFEEVLLDLGPNGAEAAYFVMDEAVVARLFLDPFVMASTDGGAGGRHPRGFGAFARVLEEYVEKQRLVSLEEAVRKMAALPAATLGLSGDRGCLAEGCAADVLVFVPGDIRARADWTSPHRLAEGMRFVIVGGAVEREGLRVLPARGGRALRFRVPKVSEKP